MFLFVDIDECSLDSDGCEQFCTNSIGSFICSCSTGYELDQDGRKCNGECNILKRTVKNLIQLCYF